MSVDNIKQSINDEKQKLRKLREELTDERRNVFFDLPLAQANWSVGRSSDWQAYIGTDDEALLEQAKSKLGYDGQAIVIPLNDKDLEVRLGETLLCIVAQQGSIEALPDVLDFANDQELPPLFPIDEEDFDRSFIKERYKEYYGSTTDLPDPQTDQRVKKRQSYSFVPALQRTLDELLHEILDGEIEPETSFTGTEPLAHEGAVRMDFSIEARRVEKQKQNE